ncbi:MAG: SprT family zinc-dependent metalloprotease [Candidatus Margulisiibacteriota bacterium]
MLKELNANLLRSHRRTLALQIAHDGGLVIRAPHRLPEDVIRQFVQKKMAWIVKKQQIARQRINLNSRQTDLNATEIKEYKQRALAVISDRSQYFAEIMGVNYKRLSITSAQQRWGSCTQQGHVNFSWRLVLQPLSIIDYVVVHELAHLRHLNHSKKFWELVSTILPDYKQRRAWLKQNGGLSF